MNPIDGLALVRLVEGSSDKIGRSVDDDDGGDDNNDDGGDDGMDDNVISSCVVGYAEGVADGISNGNDSFLLFGATFVGIIDGMEEEELLSSLMILTLSLLRSSSSSWFVVEGALLHDDRQVEGHRNRTLFVFLESFIRQRRFGFAETQLAQSLVSSPLKR